MESNNARFQHVTGEGAKNLCVSQITQLMQATPPWTKIEIHRVVSTLFAVEELGEGQNVDVTFELHKLDEMPKRELFSKTVSMTVNAVVLELLRMASEIARQEGGSSNE